MKFDEDITKIKKGDVFFETQCSSVQWRQWSKPCAVLTC